MNLEETTAMNIDRGMKINRITQWLLMMGTTLGFFNLAIQIHEKNWDAVMAWSADIVAWMVAFSLSMVIKHRLYQLKIYQEMAEQRSTSWTMKTTSAWTTP